MPFGLFPTPKEVVFAFALTLLLGAVGGGIAVWLVSL
jgi:hypothetical protein